MKSNTSAITGLSPLDGRYFDNVDPLRDIFSEYGLIRLRLHVEVEWLIHLADLPELSELSPLSDQTIARLRGLVERFSAEDALEVKQIEKEINHDVKALEYFLKKRTREIPELSAAREFIHFGCTSYDINDNCFGLMLKSARELILVPELTGLVSDLSKLATDFADIPMLARTHGQPASPTTVGKEFRVFATRLENQLAIFGNVSCKGKLSGAVGNFNSLHVANPEINWVQTAKNFVEFLGLEYSPVTTQTESHDYIAEYCHSLQRINSLLLDLSRDLWGYISTGYFKQKVVVSEVGSSAMPHKVNPIDFENAEGNLGVANALFGHLAEKLPISRWQRDLSDSTVLRNLGVPVGHSLISYKSIRRGLRKLEINVQRLNADLDNAWEVLSEAIQTVLRKYGSELPYERMKELTRGVAVSEIEIREFISGLDLPESDRETLLKLVPREYIGYAADIARGQEPSD